MQLTNFKQRLLKAGLAYLVLIGIVYFPVVFCGKTLSAAARYPWFKPPFLPAKVSVLPIRNPNTFNVDLASPAAFEEPIDIFIGAQLRKGVFPLWNPFIACGTVIQEQFSTRSLFIYQLLQNFCPQKWRDFFLLGRLFLAAMGVFIFLQIFGLKFYPAYCGGLLYGLGGSMTIFLNLTQMSNVGMVFPYALIGTELLSSKQDWPRLFFYCISVALLVLAGQPEASFYALIFTGSYAIFRIITIKNEGDRDLIRRISYLFWGTLLAFLIASPFFAPFLAHYDQFYHLHRFGGTQGIETPTPLANFWAIFMPELLRWRSELSFVTLNAGWDCLGGYVGLASTVIIIMAFRKRWWGQKAYLFFLGWAVFILLKNMGVPVISAIGKLPVFDQVWTPRWAGVTWNLSWALAAALGLEALFYRFDQNLEPAVSSDKKSKKLTLILYACLTCVILVLFSLKVVTLELSSNISFRLFITSVCLVFMFGAGALFLYLRENRFAWLFLFLALGIAWGIFNFEYQLLHIDGNFKHLINVRDKIVLFSMRQGILSSAVLGLSVLLAFARAIKNSMGDRKKFIMVLVGTVTLETMFHVTLGYDEEDRYFRLVFYMVGFLILGYYPYLKSLKKNRLILRYLVCLFLVLIILGGMLGLPVLPDRDNMFEQIPGYTHDGRLERVMGIRGLVFPNSSAAFGIQDVKSIESLSLKRSQLFRERCLLIKPQPRQQSLWFTGIIDPKLGSDIADNIRSRHRFYDLAGVSNYLSLQYENIPHTRLAADGVIKNYQNLAALPRAFIVYQWENVPSHQDALDWMLKNESKLKSQAVVEGIEAMLQLSPSAQNLTPARIKAYDLHSVTIEAQAKESGFLILTDAYYPDWRVFIDGKPGKIFPANLCFRGVFLEPGDHEVKFVYFPKVFYLCMTVSVLVILALAGLIICRMIRRKASSG